MTGEMVTVACKLPHGLQLELQDNSGTIRRVTLKGNSASRRLDTEGRTFGDLPGQVVGGYGLTQVPKDFWDKWFAKYSKANYAPVANGLVFAQNNVASASDQAKDQRELKSGLEPIDPEHKVRSGEHVVEPLNKDE